MNNYIRLFIVLFLLTFSSNLLAQNNNRLSREERRAQRAREKEEKRQLELERIVEERYFAEQQELNRLGPVTSKDVVYIFGVGTNFNDSTVYLTRIAQLDSIRIDKKTGFLPNRVEFSIQLKQYLEGTLGLINETTCIFFSDKRKKIAKYFYKLKKRYLDEGYRNMIVVDPADFSFIIPSFLLSR